jgi:ketosteroid isomerase-like protein
VLSATEGDSVEARVRARVEEWTRAVVAHDAVTLDRLLADDFTFTSSTSTGPLMSKSQYIAFVLNILEVVAFRFDDVRIRRYGNVVLMTSHYAQTGRVLGEEWEAEFLLTDVWVETAGAWHAVARHSSQPVREG